jgi:hypothetical protein
MRGFRKCKMLGRQSTSMSILGNYTDKGKIYLKHMDVYSVIIKYKILLAFPNAEKNDVIF